MTIDKLCKINNDFSKFIEQVEKLITAKEQYYNSTKKELEEFCDTYFDNDSQIQKYCEEKQIPFELEMDYVERLLDFTERLENLS